jgi:hypothetical protein
MRRNRLAIPAALAALVVVVALLPATATSAQTSAPVPASVQAELAATGKATFWVVLRGQADLASASSTQGWAARGAAVVDALKSTAARDQAGVIAALRQAGADVQPFWVVNAVRVVGGQAALDAVVGRSDVQEIRAPRTYTLPTPRKGLTQPAVDAIEWGIDRINANDVWSTYGIRGEGIVVANIDTGVQFNHPALVNQYRGNLGGGAFDHNYNWFDPSGICSNPEPCDNVDHGSHTMGTMVGSDGGANEIGVAPGARWIAAKGCESTSCSDSALLQSGQWVLAPTDLNGDNPRPDLRPNIVNNSWGSTDGSDPFYQSTVQAWVASGIFPSFSNGNSGPSCGTVGSPGSYPESYGAGAFDINGNIADFSSRGDSPFGGETKPDIAAPGVDVRSSIPGGYDSFSGTSMAAPHVSGTVALMWSAAPSIVGDVATTRTLLDQTAVDTADGQCGGTAQDNNVWGEGQLDAFAAVTQSPRGPSGTLSGDVVNARTGDPVVGASVNAEGGDVSRTTLTDAAGHYALTLGIGRYNVTVGAFGYETAALQARIREDQTTDLDVDLRPLDTYRARGRVLDETGAPVAGATVAILSTPIAPIVTGADGTFSFSPVPVGRYQLSTDAGGCYEPRTVPLVVHGPVQMNVVLHTFVDTFGYSCSLVPSAYVDATHIVNLTGDDASRQINLPFPVSLYGQSFSSVWVGTNGLLDFKSDANPYINTAIPAPEPPNLTIYGFWDDLVIDGRASVRSETIGTAPNRTFVVEWRAASFYQDTSHRITLEILLGEDGSFTTQWQSIGAFPREQGESATVGIENNNGSTAVQFSFNEARLSNGQAVRFST